MSACVLSIICALMFSFVQSSTIFTKSMIRMPISSTSPEGTSGSLLGDREKLAVSQENEDYQQIFPPQEQKRMANGTQSRALEYPQISTSLDSNITQNVYNEVESSTVSQELKQENDSTSKQAWQSRDPYVEDFFTSQTSPTRQQLSSEEISKRYWDQYKNISYGFFNSSDFLQGPKDSTDDKGIQETSFWDVLQRLYECLWSNGILNCFREGLRNEIGPFSQYLDSQFPRFHGGENLYNFEPDAGNSDMDEGRRKLTKKLQFLLPILMMLKMTMLPALAVMALVSGKAFLLSLLSLGVALFASSLHPAALSANKRHEIAPQAPPSTDHLPPNYYYLM